jgi:uncharacterized protein (TIGR01777 family)
MKILITGATGLVGKVLLERLLKKGYSNIVILTRSLESSQKYSDLPVEVHEWKSPDSELPPAEALQDVDGVFHLMGESVADGRWTKEKKERLINSRVAATENLIKGFQKFSRLPKHFVSASAVGYYGNRCDEALTESSSKGNGFLSDLCDNWEKASAGHVEMRSVHIRVGIVLSSEGGALKKMLLPFKLGAGGKLGSGQQYMSWIHIDDLVGLFIFALENEELAGPLNGVAPGAVRNVEFTKTLARTLSRPAVAPAPAFALKIILGEMSEILLAGQKALPKKVMGFGFRYQYPDLSQALDNILKKSSESTGELKSMVWIDRPVSEVFDFFSEAKNLERITPRFLNFKILSQTTPDIQEGTRFDYRLSLHGLPLKWKSEITEWEKNKSFKDVQIKGPFKRWHHSHRFYSAMGGTLVEDVVDYGVPFGSLGQFFAGPFIRKDLNQIFEYRKKVVRDFLGKSELKEKVS